MLRFRFAVRRWFIPAAALAAVAVAPSAAQAGPVRQFLANVADRAQDRREARQAARGCRPASVAFPAPAAAPAAVTCTTGAACANGVCQPARAGWR